MIPDAVLGSDLLSWSAALIVVFAAYWLVDVATRKEGLKKLFAGFGLTIRAEGALIITLAGVGTAVWPWASLPAGHVLQVWALILLAPMVWKVATLDVDVATGRGQSVERILLVLSLAGVGLSPAALGAAVWLLSRSFNAWLHHASLSLRHLALLFAFTVAWWVLQATELAAVGSEPYLIAALTMHASHYWVTAFAKGWLGGPRWYAWVWDNRLHDIAASAYSWGWARFIPEAHYLRFVRLLGWLDRPSQAAAFLLEGLAPLILVNVAFGVALPIGWILFHLVVFVASGILFLEWIFVNAGIAYLVAAHPESANVLGWTALLIGCAVMVLFPFRGILWQARPLAWWDAPWTQRIEWRVTGESGKTYALRNDFMCPHERMYGRIHGIFLFPEPMVGFHLGEVFLRELRDKILESRGEPARLEDIRRSFGIDTRDAALRARQRSVSEALLRSPESRRSKIHPPPRLAVAEVPGRAVLLLGRPTELSTARAGGRRRSVLQRRVLRRARLQEAGRNIRDAH